jgi:cell division protein FtsN
MPKDYKKSIKHAPNGRKGSMFVGIMIGLVLGLAIALGVAWYINKMPNPFNPKRVPSVSKFENPQSTSTSSTPTNESAPDMDKKPRFDFYKILPGSEEAISDQQLKDAHKKKSTDTAKGAFYLQVGAFQRAPDADNLKARLALLGIEASIQTTTLPDKGLWHRVRVGPYTNVEEVNNARSTLKQNGVETTLIKVRDARK